MIAGARRSGFTLPEMLMALVIMSGLMIAAIDVLRAFYGAQHRVLANAQTIDTRRMIAARLDRGIADQVPEVSSLSLAVGSRPTTQPVNAEGRAVAWIVMEDGAPIAVGPVRVNAPTPCTFDPVARACRP